MAHLFLNRQLDLNPLRMWLGPYKPSIDEADFIQPFKLLQADGEELAGFGLGNCPCAGRREETVAVAAKVDGGWRVF